MKQAKPKIKLKSKNSSKNSNTSTIQKGGLPKRGIGTAGIAFYQDLLNKLQPFELRWPQSMRTFDAMKNDDAIASILNITYTLVENAFTNYSIKYKKSSEKSKRAAEYLEFCLQSMDQQTFIQTVRNAQTYKEKGFSILEKIFKRVDNGGQYQGMWKISQLANRPQNSLDMSTPFEINAGGRRLVSARQNTQYFKNYFNNNLFIDPKDMADQRGRGYKTIPRKKFILFGDGATDTVPFGTPLFRSCYKAWKEKVLLEDLEVNGASKDLAGIIELAIPQEILDIAQNDPSSPEAQMVEDLLTSAANVHAGEQSYFIRPSDVQENATSMTDYSIKLLGLEGNGRQFSPGEMIQQRRKAIYDIWGAGHILTGEGSVSYNSAEVKNSIHLQYIKKDINVIEEGYNTDLIPQLLNDLNEFDLEHDELPKICAGEIDKASFDEVSKMLQRVISVGGFVATKENILHSYQLLGYPTEEMEDMTQEELVELMSLLGGNSRAGEGDGTSGTGSSQSSSGGDSNMENKSLSPFRMDKDGVYKTNNQGEKIYFDAEVVPEDLRDGFFN